MYLSERLNFFKEIKNSQLVGYFPRAVPNQTGDRLFPDGTVQTRNFPPTKRMLFETGNKTDAGHYSPGDVFTLAELSKIYSRRNTADVKALAKILNKPVVLYERDGPSVSELCTKTEVVFSP